MSSEDVRVEKEKPSVANEERVELLDDDSKATTLTEGEEEAEAPKRPEACEKMIEKMGLAPGSVRQLVMKTIQQKPSGVVMPDPGEGSEEESIIVSCTPGMVEALAVESKEEAAALAESGVALMQVIREMRAHPEKRELLRRELEMSTIKRRRRRKSSASSGDKEELQSIRRFAAEKRYQRMIGSEVSCSLNATRRDRNVGLMKEVRNSLTLSMSTLMVFIASFLMGFYLAEYLFGIRSLQIKLLYGLMTAVGGAAVETALIVMSMARVDSF